ncbi:MAG: GNAT family N-acetyltransferase [Acidimicrobiia bacterium]|nr:GNAT family N-acetyltransferase [Acidimicrobiia bacterium]
MATEIRIRPLSPADHEAAVNLARSLPEFFNDQGIDEMTTEIPTESGAVAEVDGELVGFVTWTATPELGHIGWIAVRGDHHRHGIGRRLIQVAEDDARRVGAPVLQVETLGESVDYEPYDRTRAFYRSVGFVDLESVLLDNPGMPEMLTLQKRLSKAS